MTGIGRHLATYMLAFVRVLVPMGRDTSAARELASGAFVAIAHLLILDGYPVRARLRGVKHAAGPAPALSIAVGQSLRVVGLLGAPLFAAS